MGASYGSAARPVTLYPFRRVVEVGWPAGHIALSIQLKQLHGATTESCGSPVGNTEDEPTPHFANYLTETQYDYAATGDVLFQSVGTISKNGGFHSLPLTEVAVTGLPALGAATHASHDAWAYRAEGNGAIGDIAPAEFPGSGWAQPTGTATDIVAPGASPFLAGTLATFETLTQAYNGDIACWHDAFTGLDFMSGTYSLPFVEVAPFSFDMSGIVAVYRNKAYRAFARQIVQAIPTPPTEAETDPPIPGLLWVLCQRSKADDPEPSP